MIPIFYSNFAHFLLVLGLPSIMSPYGELPEAQYKAILVPFVFRAWMR